MTKYKMDDEYVIYGCVIVLLLYIVWNQYRWNNYEGYDDVMRVELDCSNVANGNVNNVKYKDLNEKEKEQLRKCIFTGNDMSRVKSINMLNPNDLNFNRLNRINADCSNYDDYDTSYAYLNNNERKQYMNCVSNKYKPRELADEVNRNVRNIRTVSDISIIEDDCSNIDNYGMVNGYLYYGDLDSADKIKYKQCVKGASNHIVQSNNTNTVIKSVNNKILSSIIEDDCSNINNRGRINEYLYYDDLDNADKLKYEQCIKKSNNVPVVKQSNNVPVIKSTYTRNINTNKKIIPENILEILPDYVSDYLEMWL